MCACSASAATSLGLLLAHSVIVTPYIVRTALAGLSGLDPALEEAARVLGSNRFLAFWHVVVPPIAPSLGAGLVFALITSFDEVPVTVFLLPPGQATLPVAIFSAAGSGRRPSRRRRVHVAHRRHGGAAHRARALGRLRAGSSEGSTMALTSSGFPLFLTFDLDAETMWTARDPAYAQRPILMSQGAYGWKVGVAAHPRVAAPLRPARRRSSSPAWSSSSARR